MTIWIGLTGGIGSGKTTLVDFFIQFNIPVINADQLSRQLTAINVQAITTIKATFGSHFFHTDGRLNREKLRNTVFHDSQAKKKLENILLPLIFKQIENHKQQTNPKKRYGIIEIPLLVEQPQFQTLVNRILFIQANTDIRLKRVKLRSHLDENTVHAIMLKQASDLERLLITDDVITNNKTADSLYRDAFLLHQFYQTLS